MECIQSVTNIMIPVKLFKILSALYTVLKDLKEKQFVALKLF